MQLSNIVNTVDNGFQGGIQINTPTQSGYAGGSETRPANVALHPIICL